MVSVSLFANPEIRVRLLLLSMWPGSFHAWRAAALVCFACSYMTISRTVTTRLTARMMSCRCNTVAVLGFAMAEMRLG